MRFVAISSFLDSFLPGVLNSIDCLSFQDLKHSLSIIDGRKPFPPNKAACLVWRRVGDILSMDGKSKQLIFIHEQLGRIYA